MVMGWSISEDFTAAMSVLLTVKIRKDNYRVVSDGMFFIPSSKETI
jgi:hypothetical protein